MLTGPHLPATGARDEAVLLALSKRGQLRRAHRQEVRPRAGQGARQGDRRTAQVSMNQELI